MEKIIIFGAGQAGRMMANWLGADIELVAFADNSSEKQGGLIGDRPVLSAGRAVEEAPDRIIVAMLNEDSCHQVKDQLRSLGFRGEISDSLAFKELYDLRLAFLRRLAEEMRKRKLKGDIAELGVYQGRFAAELNAAFPDRTLHLFDSFEGFDGRDRQAEAEKSGRAKVFQDFSSTSPDLVRERLPYPDRAVFYPGYFPETVPDEDLSFALVSLDVDLYQPTLEGLRYFYPRLVKGGSIIIDDYNSLQYPGVKEAVDVYCQAEGIMVLPLMDLHGVAVIHRS